MVGKIVKIDIKFTIYYAPELQELAEKDVDKIRKRVS